jgi:hypothetical protein
MAYRKGSVNRMLQDEYCFIRLEERPRRGTHLWNQWLDNFCSKHAVEVSRMTEPLAERAVKVLRYDMPNFD